MSIAGTGRDAEPLELVPVGTYDAFGDGGLEGLKSVRQGPVPSQFIKDDVSQRALSACLRARTRTSETGLDAGIVPYSGEVGKIPLNSAK